MTDSGKFVYFPLRKPAVIQPECPVHIYCYGLAKQKCGDAAFVQIRLVNRTERKVHSVFLQISGRDSLGNVLYELQYVPLVDCKGDAYKDFGEEQPLFLPQGDVHTLDMQVLDVLFEDGMIWRKQNSHRLMTAAEAGWVTCTCGMKNPSESKCCVFCGKSMGSEAEGEKNVYFPVEQAPIAEVIEPVAEVIEPVAEEREFAVKETEPPIEEEEPVAEKILPVAEEGTSAIDNLFLADLLGPVWAKVKQIEQEEAARNAETVTSLEYPVENEGSTTEKEPEPSTEITEEELASEYMQETQALLRQMQARIRAREMGEELPVEEKSGETVEPETDIEQQRKERSRGILFWVLMVILLILLGGTAFFAVLYWKGYFA